MAVDDVGDVNVFLSPRVGFAGESPSTQHHPPSSLLTFADMVIALDSRGTGGTQDFDYGQFGGKLKADHTYASVNDNSRVVTRSQSLKTSRPPPTCMDVASNDEEDDDSFSHSGESSTIHSLSRESGLDLDLDIDLDLSRGEDNINSEEDEQLSPPSNIRRQKNKGKGGRQRSRVTKVTNNEQDCHHRGEESRVVKRSSSFERVHSQVGLEFDRAGCSREWPQVTKKHTPRKSCSFEEVNRETDSRKGEVQRGGSSGQLHRLVNDTLEFPCWPRKADHTYATATWDGTAASHSLFEQEMCQETGSISIDSKSQDHHLKMDVAEAYIVPLRSLDIENYCKRGNTGELFQNFSENKCAQQTNKKDDHTYVKHNSDLSSSYTASSSDGSKPINFSCATFPRQKSRDDHTYFHSGMIRRGNCASGGKDLVASHSVSDLSTKKELSGTASCSTVNASMESVSTKRDHNYSTSS